MFDPKEIQIQAAVGGFPTAAFLFVGSQYVGQSGFLSCSQTSRPLYFNDSLWSAAADACHLRQNSCTILRNKV